MMKLKPNQTRTYDGDGFKKRAACLCFKNEREEEVRKDPSVTLFSCILSTICSPQAGVKGKLGRLLGVFEQNQDRKHRTYVYVLTVTETLEDWEDSVNIGRKREWFTVEEAIKVLQSHKPVHAEYLRRLQLSCSPTNGNSILPSPSSNDNYPHYSATPTTPSTGSVLGSSCR
ncbi:diphosphoinositol polyphosphate phosphohydrolase NUDT4B [Neolamprologus brichardi]|uniref:diphosphoinositol polyphosphate phosphohydrolase NUDT4B n=1 Tax=Neolamprologus brichardi TaxID=32507 RepID=UPI0016439957|nr:diphosphoinositol polyphosphate phosphohydrolase NUDT4B [Neolamprologus brichardi]